MQNLPPIRGTAKCRGQAKSPSQCPLTHHAQDLIQDIKICAPQYDKSKALIRHQNAAPFIEVSKLSQDFSLFLIPSPSRRLGAKATRLISTATQQSKNCFRAGTFCGAG